MFVSNVCLYFQGPPGLQVVWRSGYPNSGFFQDYAAVIDIDEEKPSPISIDSCGALQYRSTLSIMLTNTDNGRMYVCAARYDNDPELVDNITLSLCAAGIPLKEVQYPYYRCRLVNIFVTVCLESSRRSVSLLSLSSTLMSPFVLGVITVISITTIVVV
ncbi:hypothetical protein RRG08_066137 [Elysia crispata]|uniref:Ig-like domain-containing protein n=1 Tax=Elysia crispata TaxID=231223 RepID=A0AAE1B9J8_9GAST|nr:hypothetical protein RRG08_066137 [Elysia crispata]